MQAIFIKDLASLSPKDAFAVYALVTEVVDKVASNRSEFRILRLRDRTGTVDVSVFDNMVCYGAALETMQGDVLCLEGTADFFKNAPSPRPDRLTRYTQASLPQAVADCVFTSSPVPLEQLLHELECGVAKIKNEALRKTVRDLTGYDKFRVAPPSGEGNRSYRRGLLEYACACLNTLPGLLALYPQVQSDVVYAGLLTHGIGYASTWSPGEPKESSSITHGNAVLSFTMFRREAMLNKVHPRLMEAVEHVLLAGSVRYVVRPATPEAVLVNAVLDLHESMGIVEGTRAATTGEISAFVRGLSTSVVFIPQATEISSTQVSPPPPPPPPCSV